MKKILILTGLFFAVNLAIAQKTEHVIKVQGNPQQMTLVVQNMHHDIEIQGTDQGEIKIVAKGYAGIPDKAKGLTPLSAAGPDNSGIGLNIENAADKITITGVHRPSEDVKYIVSVPKTMKLKVEMNSWQGGDATFRGLAGEVEVKTQVGDLKFVDVSGPIVATTLSSDITVVFRSLSQVSPSSIASTSGEIDITLPANTKGNFKMASITGEVYTDLPFAMPENKGLKQSWGGTSLNATLNGGGVAVDIKSISGNIYIRKSN